MMSEINSTCINKQFGDYFEKTNEFARNICTQTYVPLKASSTNVKI